MDQVFRRPESTSMALRPASGTFLGNNPVSDGSEIAAFDYILLASSYILRHRVACARGQESGGQRDLPTAVHGRQKVGATVGHGRVHCDLG